MKVSIIKEKSHNYFHLRLIGMALTSLEQGWVEVNKKLCKTID